VTIESVILTALPNGFDGLGRLKVTVFVTPRLSTEGPDDLTLASFPAFVDWPASVETLVQQGGLVLEIESAGALNTELDPVAPALDSGMWRQLLDPDAVGVHASDPHPGNPGAGFRDLSTRVVRSFPTGLVASQILGLYRDVATTYPTSFPPVSDGPLAGFADRLGDLARNPGRFYDELDGLLAKESGPEDKSGRYVDDTGLSASARERLAFIQAQRFYDRPGERDPAGPTAAPDPPEVPPIDFHSFCSFLGDYPRLLRPLGLAIDLVAESPGLSEGETGRIRVEFRGSLPPELEFASQPEARPWTNFEHRDRRFIPRPRNREMSDLVDGTLRLEQDWFTVQQVDVDGSALKTIEFAANVRQIATQIASGDRSMTPDEAGLPALRTGGFVIARENRAGLVVAQLDKAAEHEKDRTGHDPADLFAEDVTRGYRPDVFDVSKGLWYSLTARDGTYSVEVNGSTTPLSLCPEDPTPATCRDEGFVKGASTTAVPGETDPELYLHEVLSGWDGWSLAAKRPGKAIVDSEGEVLGQPEEPPPEAFPLVTRFKAAPGTLPRLRFGREYHFRVRAVDLAGNSVPEKDLNPSHQTDLEVFLRFDPVPSPAVLPRRPFSEGESLMRMVIRSTLGVLPAPYIALPRIVGLSEHTTPATAYRDRNERHVAAPKSSVQLAEWHSMLDIGIGQSKPQADLDTAFDIAARESGSFIDAGPGASVVNPASPVNATDLASHPRGHALKPGEYVIRDVDKLALPYLPDPASAGAAFSSLPGGPLTTTIAWPRDLPSPPEKWWDRQPILIRIEDGGLTNAPQKTPEWIPAARLLRVYLRQAEMVTVRLSCQPTAEGVGVSGILDLLDPGVRLAQATDSLAGRNWMLTPFQDLTLVHAVEKPLVAPVVNVVDTGVTRNEGETFAVLGGQIDNHARSTGRLDIDATWTEPIDDPGKDLPQDADHLGEIEGQAHVGDFLLEAVEDGCRIGRDDVPAGTNPAVHKVRHEFRDTKHRQVTYGATATTRFREYFPTEITNQKALITHVGPTKSLSVPSSRRPDPPDVEYAIPTFRWVDETYRGLPAGLTSSDVSPRVARALAGIRGGARLLERGAREERVAMPPGVRLPLIRRRVRKCGLRVYLGRPWYSSGVDELLAVVVPDQPYILWPIDVDRGLVTDAVTRAIADVSAGQILGRGRIRETRGKRLAASERLVRSVRRLRPEAGSLAEAIADPEALLSAFQTEQLEGLLEVIGPIFLAGDPETYVTRYGNDPIWGSDPVAGGPWIHQFPLRSRVGTGLSLAEAPARTVAAIGHRPQFDPDRKLWYCDIDIDAGTSYFPFVRLGLARYQPYSIPGVHLSRVVTPEWAQILPTRAATISRPLPGRARVSLRGPAGYNAVAREVLGSTAGSGPEGMGLSRFAVAQVERLPAGATTDLAWRPAGDEVKLSLDMRSAWSDIEYSGWLPVPSAAAGEQLRVTIREYEILQTDLSQADDVIKHSTIETQEIELGPFGSIEEIVVKQDDRPVRFRLVYADRFSL
jgi:hypothetical protein